MADEKDIEKIMYKVVFTQFEKIYEIYARYISEETLMGFIEIDEIVFNDSGVVLDPTEERLKNEFRDVKRSYIPMHTILRIDEVPQQGVAKIKTKDGNTSGNVSHITGADFAAKEPNPS
jgi:hypothetical protein